MNCEDVARILAAYVEGDEGTAASAAIRAHLEACEDCRRQEQDLRLLSLRLRGLPDRLGLPGPLAPQPDATSRRGPSRRVVLALVAITAWAAATTALLAMATVNVIPIGSDKPARDRIDQESSVLRAENAKLKDALASVDSTASFPGFAPAIERYLESEDIPLPVAGGDALTIEADESDARNRARLLSIIGFRMDGSTLVAHIRVEALSTMSVSPATETPGIVDLDVWLVQRQSGAWTVTKAKLTS